MRQRIRTRTVIILVVVAIVLTVLIAYASGQGRLSVAVAQPGEYTYYLLPKDGSAPIKKQATETASHFVASGEYAVEYTETDKNSTSLTYVTVPGFFRSGSATVGANPQQRVERLTSQVDAILTLDERGALYSVPALRGTATRYDLEKPYALGQPFDLPLSNDLPYSIVNGRMVGFQKGALRVPTAKLTPSLYDFDTNKMLSLNKQYENSASSVYVVSTGVANSTVYGIVYEKDGKQLIDTFNGSQFISTFDISTTALTDSGRIAAMTDKYVAMAYGNDAVDDHDTKDDSRLQLKDLTIDILDKTSRDKLRTVNAGPISPSSYSLSAKGTYVAVAHDNIISVFNTITGDRSFATDLTAAGDILWLDDNRFLVTSDAHEIRMVDINQRVARTVFAPGKLRISEFTVKGNRLLFSAYNNAKAATNNTKPDAYIAYLNETATDDNQLVTKLPYRDSSAYIQAFGKTIYVQSLQQNVQPSAVSSRYQGLTPDSNDYRRAAQAFLQKNMINYQQYRIVYGQELVQ